MFVPRDQPGNRFESRRRNYGHARYRFRENRIMLCLWLLSNGSTACHIGYFLSSSPSSLLIEQNLPWAMYHEPARLGYAPGDIQVRRSSQMQDALPHSQPPLLMPVLVGPRRSEWTLPFSPAPLLTRWEETVEIREAGCFRASA